MSVPLTVKLRADGSELQRDVSRTISQVRNNILGMMSVGVVTAALRQLASEMERIKDMSEQLNISTTAFQELDFALKQVGLGGEALVTYLNKINQIRQAALAGDEKSAMAFARLGISMGEVRDMNMDELFTRLAKAIAAIPDPMEQSAVAADMLGKGGARVVGVLREIEALRERAREQGLIFSQSDIEQADAVLKKLDAILQRVKVLTARGIVGFAEGITASGKAMSEAEQKIFERVAEKRGPLAAIAVAVSRRARAVSESVVPENMRQFMFGAAPFVQLEKMLGGFEAQAEVLKEVSEEQQQRAAQRASELQRASEVGWYSTIEDYERARRNARVAEREAVERRRMEDLTQFQSIGAYVPRDDAQREVANNLRQLVMTNQQILQMLRQIGSPAWSML